MSCDDKLDITPKGMTILNKVSDLELLLNNNMNLGSNRDLCNVCNECYPDENANLLMKKTNTVQYAILTYDEKVDRAALTAEDEKYSAAYKNINYMNTILDKIESADGDETAKKAQEYLPYFELFLKKTYKYVFFVFIFLIYCFFSVLY